MEAPPVRARRFTAAAAKRITDRGAVAPEWRDTLIRLVRDGSDEERRAAIRGIGDETVVADVTDPVALAAWFAGHTPSGALVARLAASPDGAVVGALIHALPDDALRSLDIRAMAGTMIYHRDKAAWEFASRADKLTPGQLAALVETGLASVNMLAGSRPLTDAQWAALDRVDHEGTQNTVTFSPACGGGGFLLKNPDWWVQYQQAIPTCPVVRTV